MVRLALGLALVVVAAPARADVSVEDGVPFTAPELTEALLVRGTAVRDIMVRALSGTAIELQTPAGRQRVDLGMTHGAEAARLVALQLAPLSLDAALPAPLAVASSPSRGQAEDSGWMLGISAGGGRGIAPIEVALGVVRADATCARGLVRYGASIGWLHGFTRHLTRAAPSPANPAGTEDLGAVHANLGVVRAVVGFAYGPFELVAGPELIGYAATSTPSGAMFGAGGSLRVLLVGGAGWQAIASADLDVFGKRVIVARGGAELVATPSFALTAALGVAWEGP